MNLPFSLDQFLDVFRQYNETVWPAQWVLISLGVLAVIAAAKGGRGASRLAVVILASLWIWVGAAYHLAFFKSINPAATLFGLAFIAQGLLFAWTGLASKTLRFEGRFDAVALIGFGLVAYGLLAYPIVGDVLGHRYPSAPSFGVPCPTAIFTFGLLLLSAPPRPRRLMIMPVGWALLGVSAAVQLGMWEDTVLVVAAVVCTIIVLVQRPRSRSAAAHRDPVGATAS